MAQQPKNSNSEDDINETITTAAVQNNNTMTTPQLHIQTENKTKPHHLFHNNNSLSSVSPSSKHKNRVAPSPSSSAAPPPLPSKPPPHSSKSNSQQKTGSIFNGSAIQEHDRDIEGDIDMGKEGQTHIHNVSHTLKEAEEQQKQTKPSAPLSVTSSSCPSPSHRASTGALPAVGLTSSPVNTCFKKIKTNSHSNSANHSHHNSMSLNCSLPLAVPVLPPLSPNNQQSSTLKPKHTMLPSLKMSDDEDNGEGQEGGFITATVYTSNSNCQCRTSLCCEDAAENNNSPSIAPPRLGLRLPLEQKEGGQVEEEEESEISTIEVLTQNESKDPLRHHLDQTHSQLLHTQNHNRPTLPVVSPRPTTAGKPPPTHGEGEPHHAHHHSVKLKPDDTITFSTTTTTTTTVTTTTTSAPAAATHSTVTTPSMRLLPLISPTHSNNAVSTPFIPSTQNNTASTTSTTSRAAKLDYFLHDCTQITDYLFISGQIVASDHALLSKHGITHIINACGAICDNYFEGMFTYFRLFLQDRGSEDILCIMYDAIDFIESARLHGHKVLIHCQQGVSRSTILAIGYLMLIEHTDYDSIYERVRSKRGITRPNFGFMCQLLAWYKRIHGLTLRSLALYRFAYHSNQDHRIVNKWMDALDGTAFDSRFVLLLQSPHALYIWIGEDVSTQRWQRYEVQVKKIIQKLQQYEFAVFRCICIRRIPGITGTTESTTTTTVTATRAAPAVEAMAASSSVMQTEQVTDVSDKYNLSPRDRERVEQRRAEIRAEIRRQEGEDMEHDEDVGGPEGNAVVEDEDNDTDRQREQQHSHIPFDESHPEEFFYAVLGGRPAWHTHNPAFNDDYAAENTAHATAIITTTSITSTTTQNSTEAAITPGANAAPAAQHQSHHHGSHSISVSGSTVSSSLHSLMKSTPQHSSTTSSPDQRPYSLSISSSSAPISRAPTLPHKPPSLVQNATNINAQEIQPPSAQKPHIQALKLTLPLSPSSAGSASSIMIQTEAIIQTTTTTTVNSASLSSPKQPMDTEC